MGSLPPVADPNTAPGPITIVAKPSAGREAEAEVQVGRVPTRRSRDVDDLGIVARDVYDFRLSGLDEDNFPVGYDFLFRCVDERTGGAGAVAKALDGLHDLSRLGEEGFAELLGPSEVFVEPSDDVRISREAAYTIIPGLILKPE